MYLDKKNKMNQSDIEKILNIESEKELYALIKDWQAEKWKLVGNMVYLRGLIELGNECIKDCYYCGIRKSSTVDRYILNIEDVMTCAKYAYENKFGSLVIQSGERQDNEFVEFVESLLYKINNITNGCLRITLSLGEQSHQTYKKWFDAGAKRYLLRIETSNPKLYKKIHPNSCNYDERLKALYNLKEIGFQTGTGVMIGLPEQTIEDLTNDLLFFKSFDIDMIGMGPYIPHKETPLAKKFVNKMDINFIRKQKMLTLKMIFVARHFLKNVNIASTTALQSLYDNGLIDGIMAGANVIMPNITSAKFKKSYYLYEGKANNSIENLSLIEDKLKKIGEQIIFGEFGDSQHFKLRSK